MTAFGGEASGPSDTPPVAQERDLGTAGLQSLGLGLTASRPGRGGLPLLKQPGVSCFVPATQAFWRRERLPWALLWAGHLSALLTNFILN